MCSKVLPLLPLFASGCGTAWIMTQASGTQGLWDEHVHEVAVPQPGVDERLTVTLPLTSAAPASATPAPHALTCTTAQHGHERVYHAAFRYGSSWKKATAVFFAMEAVGAATLLLAGDGQIDDQTYGALLAADAAITGAIFFIPRKEIYRSDERDAMTPVRSDCPDGLTVQIGGDTFAIDAAGRLGDVGEVALTEWLRTSAGELAVAFAGQTALMQPNAGPGPRSLGASFAVPEGTLSLAP